MALFSAVRSVVLLLILSYMQYADGCANLGYRNYLLEYASTSLCGESGSTPMGVCALATTCSMMGGEPVGRFNCPLTQNTCCRPTASCNATTAAINLLWESVDYNLASRLSPSVCELNIVSGSDTCYIRFDFDDMDLQATRVDHCDYSYLQFNPDADDKNKICGTLNHKTTFVKVTRNLMGFSVPVRAVLNMQHFPHKYSVRINHIKCDQIKGFRQPRLRSLEPLEDIPARTAKQIRRNEKDELPYMARLYAVSYTKKPYIRSCPVVFISKSILIGPASCAFRLGGPGTSKGLMVVHGASHEGDPSTYPSSVGAQAKYVAANGIVVKEMVFHPNYNHRTKENDLAIYVLNNTVQKAEPVELPSPSDDFVKLQVYMARYNYYKMSDDVTVLSDPEEKVTRVVSNRECEISTISSISSVASNDTICLAPTPREKMPCRGETGSPIVHIGSSGTVTLIGLLMGGYGDDCDGSARPHNEPALKLTNYLDLIDAVTSPAYTIPSEPVQDTLALRPFVSLYNSIFSSGAGEAN